MAGNDDRIHGYNPIYRDEQGPLKFCSFDLSRQNRPTNFINRTVNVIPIGGAVVSDHQGHIVPQNMLNTILDPLMENMAALCDNLDKALQYIQDHAAWMTDVYNYGVAIGVPMFDFSDNDPENKVGGFFSIVTWNPVNICRAPADNTRNGEPGNTIDAQVAAYLDANQVAQGVNAQCMASLNALILHPNDVNYIEDYITQCSATLAGQQLAGIGYYAFPWVNNANVLSPQ